MFHARRKARGVTASQVDELPPAIYTYAIQYLAKDGAGNKIWKGFGPGCSGVLTSSSTVQELALAIMSHFLEGVQNPAHFVRVVVWTGDRTNGPLREAESAVIVYDV
jgi:hypothetical protein